jgi:hypothetical protein
MEQLCEVPWVHVSAPDVATRNFVWDVADWPGVCMSCSGSRKLPTVCRPSRASSQTMFTVTHAKLLSKILKQLVPQNLILVSPENSDLHVLCIYVQETKHLCCVVSSPASSWEGDGFKSQSRVQLSFFYASPQALQAESKIVSQIRLQLLPSTSLQLS